jgi:hypothetical protein
VDYTAELRQHTIPTTCASQWCEYPGHSLHIERNLGKESPRRRPPHGQRQADAFPHFGHFQEAFSRGSKIGACHDMFDTIHASFCLSLLHSAYPTLQRLCAAFSTTNQGDSDIAHYGEHAGRWLALFDSNVSTIGPEMSLQVTTAFPSYFCAMLKVTDKLHVPRQWLLKFLHFFLFPSIFH